MQSIENKKILLIISGGIAAYKALELIRLIRRAGGQVRGILTQGGAQFITPLSVASLTGEAVYTDLWSLKDETEMGHIRLSREADLIVIAPTSADMIARTAHGLAGDLAAAVLLASDKPVLFAPAMNARMWINPATQDNVKILEKRGMIRIGPGAGELACGETGPGRMAEPQEILDAIAGFFAADRPLAGLHALVTSGPTFEPIDPVRFIGNRSSGKQGHAVAAALAGLGAAVTLVSGPVALPDPAGVKTVRVETAQQMLDACRRALPADIAVCAAAVSDWAPATAQAQKIKKSGGKTPPQIALKENPDILAALSRPGPDRPRLVVGFAAETENLPENATAKLKSKGCDWIVANLVAAPDAPVFGEDSNSVRLLTGPGKAEDWPEAAKAAIAARLARRIAAHVNDSSASSFHKIKKILIKN